MKKEKKKHVATRSTDRAESRGKKARRIVIHERWWKNGETQFDGILSTLAVEEKNVNTFLLKACRKY